MSQVAPATVLNEVIEQRRDELARAAQRSAAANHPRVLMLLALAGLTLAMLLFAIAYKRHVDARTRFEDLTNRATNTLAEAAKLRRLRDLKTERDRAGGGAAAGSWLGQLEGIGREAGLGKPLPVPTTRTDRPAGRPSRTTVTYNLRDDNLAPILAWLDRSISEIPGVELSSLLIKPEAEQWFATVQLVRLERAE